MRAASPRSGPSRRWCRTRFTPMPAASWAPYRRSSRRPIGWSRSRARCRASRRSRPAVPSTRAARTPGSAARAIARSLSNGLGTGSPATSMTRTTPRPRRTGARPPRPPRKGCRRERSPRGRRRMSTPYATVRDLRRVFDVSKPWLNRVLEGGEKQYLKAVDGVSFDIAKGETFALVGESGSGKSTVARMVVGLLAPTSGEVTISGISMSAAASAAERQRLRRRIQMIFQDPYASLNPRWGVDRIVAEPIRAFRLIKGERAIRDRVGELLTLVGLHPDDGVKYPHEFSGGQRQRIAIAP